MDNVELTTRWRKWQEVVLGRSLIQEGNTVLLPVVVDGRPRTIAVTFEERPRG